MKRAMNGITSRNAQMGGTFQFQRNVNANRKTTSGIVQTIKAHIIATDILMVLLTFRARWSWTHDNSSSVCLIFVFSFHAIVTYIMVRRPIGTRRKVIKVVVRNLFLVSTWSKAGAQDVLQYVTLLLSENNLKV